MDDSKKRRKRVKIAGATMTRRTAKRRDSEMFGTKRRFAMAENTSSQPFRRSGVRADLSNNPVQINVLDHLLFSPWPSSHTFG